MKAQAITIDKTESSPIGAGLRLSRVLYNYKKVKKSWVQKKA